MGVSVGVSVGVEVGVSEGVAVAVGVSVKVGVAVLVGVGVVSWALRMPLVIVPQIMSATSKTPNLRIFHSPFPLLRERLN
jgi:hypothetical protein